MQENLHRFGNHQHVLRAMARVLFPRVTGLHSFDNRLHVLLVMAHVLLFLNAAT